MRIGRQRDSQPTSPPRRRAVPDYTQRSTKLRLFVMVAALMVIVAFAAMSYGKKQLADFHALAQTRATVKENLEWIQSKSAQR